MNLEPLVLTRKVFLTVGSTSFTKIVDSIGGDGQITGRWLK